MAFIEGWPHLRGGLCEGFHCTADKTSQTFVLCPFIWFMITHTLSISGMRSLHHTQNNNTYVSYLTNSSMSEVSFSMVRFGSRIAFCLPGMILEILPSIDDMFTTL